MTNKLSEEYQGTTLPLCCSAPNSMLYFHQTTSESGDGHGQERKSDGLRHKTPGFAQLFADLDSHRHPVRQRPVLLHPLEIWQGAGTEPAGDPENQERYDELTWISDFFNAMMVLPGHAEDWESVKTALLYAAEQAENKAA